MRFCSLQINLDRMQGTPIPILKALSGRRENRFQKFAAPMRCDTIAASMRCGAIRYQSRSDAIRCGADIDAKR